MEPSFIGPSTRIPVKYRFATDRCPHCQTARHLPQGIAQQTREQIDLDYLCGDCGHKWITRRSRDHASKHSSTTLNEFIIVARLALNDEEMTFKILTRRAQYGY